MAINVDISKELSSFKLKVAFNEEGGTLGFLGASGSGKSLTLRCIAGLDKPDKGEIIINSRAYFNSYNGLNLKSQSRKVGYLFQNYALFPNMTVKENIYIAASLNKAIKRNLVMEYIERFRLQGLEKSYPWQLSGGQQQRVALARALIISPEVLLLDEPFSALDQSLRYKMEEELISILKDYKGNIIFVTHDIEEAYRVCDNILVFDNGYAVNSKNKIELFNNPSSLAEARITGCKNISKIIRTGEFKFFAAEYGIELISKEPINTNISYMGIRAHNIELTTGNSYENSSTFTVENIIDNPFNYIVTVKNKSFSSSKQISFYLDKKKLNFKMGENINIKFPKEHIFTF